jgi:hypothetical protein
MIEMTRLSGISLLLAGCLLSVAAACSDDGNEGGALAALSTEELAEYHAMIDSLGETAGFELLRPTYLPGGTDWLPSTDYIEDGEMAILQFYPIGSLEPEFERLVILIDQVADPNERHCPPCPGVGGSDLESYQLGETEVVLDEGRSGGNWVFLAGVFRTEEIRVHARFNWELEPRTPLLVTEDMRAEALRLMRSMLQRD